MLYLLAALWSQCYPQSPIWPFGQTSQWRDEVVFFWRKKFLSFGERNFLFYSPIEVDWLIVNRPTYARVTGANHSLENHSGPLLTSGVDAILNPLHWPAWSSGVTYFRKTSWATLQPCPLPAPPPKKMLPHSLMCVYPSSHCQVIKLKSVPHLAMSSLKAGAFQVRLSLAHSESAWDDANVLQRDWGYKVSSSHYNQWPFVVPDDMNAHINIPLAT